MSKKGCSDMDSTRAPHCRKNLKGRKKLEGHTGLRTPVIFFRMGKLALPPSLTPRAVRGNCSHTTQCQQSVNHAVPAPVCQTRQLRLPLVQLGG